MQAQTTKEEEEEHQEDTNFQYPVYDININPMQPLNFPFLQPDKTTIYLLLFMSLFSFILFLKFCLSLFLFSLTSFLYFFVLGLLLLFQVVFCLPLLIFTYSCHYFVS